MLKLYVFILLVFTATFYSQSSDDLNKRGLAEFERGDYNAAIEDFSQIIDQTSRLDKRSDSLRRDFTERKLSPNNERENIRVLDPRTAEAYANRGKAYFAKGDPQQAISDYDHALTITPSLTAVNILRGIARIGTMQFDLASIDFERAIKLDGKSPEAFIGRATARQALGDRAGAAADFEVAVKLQPKNAIVYYFRGESRRTIGDLDGATADFERSLKLNPKSAPAYLGRGLIHLGYGEFEQAIQDLTTAVSLDGRLGHAYANRGFAYRFLGKQTLADADFKRAVELDPTLEADIALGKSRIPGPND